MRFLRLSLLALIAMVTIVSAQNEGEKPRPRPKGEKKGDRQERESRGVREGRGHHDRFIAAYDRDKDGAVGWAEFESSKKVSHLELEGRRRIFNHLDKNKDGKITGDELPKGGRKPGKRGDLNNDGKIDLEEFRKRMKDAKPERAEEMFKRMDKDGDGYLTPSDFPRPRRGPSFDRGSLEKLDTNKDKSLSFEEWKKSPRLKDLSEERRKEMFDRIDRNDDGLLNETDRPEAPPRRPAG